MATYNNVLASLSGICSRHAQINTFYYGGQSDFQTTAELYPAVILSDAQGSSVGAGEIKLNFLLFVIDLLNKDYSNMSDVKSDCLQIFCDLLAHLKDDEETYDFMMDSDLVYIQPVEEVQDDILAGWVAQITITIPFQGSNCINPIAAS